MDGHKRNGFQGYQNSSHIREKEEGQEMDMKEYLSSVCNGITGLADRRACMMSSMDIMMS